MKLLAVITFFAFSLVACGPGSSPEGRMGMKTDKLQQQIDSLKTQNTAIKDSLGKIIQELKDLKKQPR